MNRKNLDHIKENFTEQTGVIFRPAPRRGRRLIVIAAAVVFAVLLATAAAASGFGALIARFGLQPENTEYDYLGYIENYESLISSCDGVIVHPLTPGTGSLYVGGEENFTPEADFVLHDPSLTIAQQRDRWYEMPASLDIYRHYLAGPEDHAFEVSVFLPCEAGSGGRIKVPVIYLFIYDKNDVEPDSYTFIRGKLYRFSELEPYYTFEKDGCVFYDVSPLIISDLEEEAAYAVSTHPDEAYTQTKRDTLYETYAYLQENLPNMILRFDEYRMLTENDHSVS